MLWMRLSGCALVALAAAGCGDRGRLWSAPLALVGPQQAAGQLLWIDATRGLVFALEPHGAAAPTVRSARVRRNARFAAPAPGGERLLVLSAGQEAVYRDQTAEEPGLTIVLPVAGGAPAVESFYPLSGPFDRLAVSRDGKQAVASYSSEGGGGGLFRNPNEVALLDLGASPGPDNPVLRTVRSFGSAPLGVVFSPPMPIPAPSGKAHSLAVVLASGYLTLLDLGNPRRREITVPLAKPDSAVAITPEQVFFSPTTGTIFVRAAGAADLYSIALVPRAPSAPDENDFVPAINQPSSGRTPLDMVLFADGGKDMILTANASGDLALIDAATSQFSLVTTGAPVDTLLLPAGSSLALGYRRLAPEPRIHFIELKGLAQKLEKNVTARKLDQAVHQLVATPDGKQALVVHNAQRTVVSVLDLAGQHHTVSPIQGQLPLGSFDFASGAAGSYLVGVSSSIARLGLLDLSNLHTGDLRLDQAPQRVYALGDTIVVDHATHEGAVTVVPSARATREESRLVWGFLLGGLLDRELGN
jgi:hypothetical protein